MQILNLATLFAVIGASSAFNHRHVQLAKRQLTEGGALGSASASSSGATSIISSSTSTSSSRSSSTSAGTSSTSTSNVALPPPTSTTVTSTGASQTTTTTQSTGSQGTQTSSTSSTVLTGDATLSASGVPALASISSGMPTEMTSSLFTTFTPGATPVIPGAPVLPSAFVFSPADWPQQDKVPPTDSPEVQEWMKELNGYNIPDIPTTDGTCQGSPQAAANAQQNGWWTCGSWTRATDITTCPTKMTWGVSFDDGPSPWTPKLLDFLSQKQVNATFFVVGSRAIQYPATLVDEYMSGHEIAVHTWSHTALTSQTNAQIVAEFGWTRKAIKDVTGVTPVFMRPPYGDIDDRVRAISLAMGLVPIIWTKPQTTGIPFDTNDWKVAGGLVTSVQSYETFQGILGNATAINTGFVVLQHDLFEVTVDLAVGYTLNSALTHQPPFTLEPIAKCNGFPTTDLYRETTKNTTFPYPNSTSADVAGNGSTDTPGGNKPPGSSAMLLRPPVLIAGLVSVLLSALW